MLGVSAIRMEDDGICIILKRYTDGWNLGHVNMSSWEKPRALFGSPLLWRAATTTMSYA